MTLKSEIYDRLIADVPIAAIVGTKVYSNLAPESASLPLIVFSFISTTPEHDMSGASGLVRSRVQIDCYEQGATLVKTLSEAVRTAFQGFTGLMGAVRVLSTVLDDEFDDVVESKQGHPAMTYRTSMDFMFWYKQSIPTF